MLHGEEPTPPANVLEGEDETDNHGEAQGLRVMAFVVLMATAGKGLPISLSVFKFLTVVRTQLSMVPIGPFKTHQPAQAP